MYLTQSTSSRVDNVVVNAISSITATIIYLHVYATTVISRVFSGAYSLVKNGNGALTLSGINTYTLGTTLNAGSLVSGNSSSIGTGTLTLNGGQFSATGGQTITNNVVIGGNVTFVSDSLNTIGFSGTVDLGSAIRTLTSNASGALSYLLFTNVISGSGGITFAGNNRFRFSGQNTYSGASSITGSIIVRVSRPLSGSVSGFGYAEFTATTLTVSFSINPASGNTYRLFPGSTTQTYSSVTLIGTTGRTATYNSSNSTLTII